MQENRKLLYIVEAMGGGVFTYIVDLANQLVNQYDMYIAYAVRAQTPPNYKEYFDDRIHLIEVQNFTRSVQFAKDIKAFFEIRKIVNSINPDIIHLHSSKAGVLGRWAINGKKVPLFYTPHGYSFLMSDHSRIKRTAYKLIESISAKRACVTISCSEGEHQETLKLTRRATYVDNGINTNEFQRLIDSANYQNAVHSFTVFTLGRVCYQKNPVLFNLVAKAMPDVHFVWIGDGELRSELNAPNIEVTGWMDRKCAIERSLSADVFMLTSLWEGLPISLLEAMFMRKPCVVSDVIGNHDVIHTRINGYVCNSVTDFVNSIMQIKEGKAGIMVDTAYQDIRNKYNTVTMAKKYSCIYINSLQEAGGGVQHDVIVVPPVFLLQFSEYNADAQKAVA